MPRKISFSFSEHRFAKVLTTFKSASLDNDTAAAIVAGICPCQIVIVDQKTGIAYTGDIAGGDEFRSDLRMDVLHHLGLVLK